MTIRPVVLTVIAVAVLLLGDVRPVAAQRQSVASADALDTWVALVKAHTPGRPDAAVKAVTAMTWAARRELNTAFPLFIRILRDRDVIVSRSVPDKTIVALAQAVRLTPGPETFLKRAAVLHADAAVFADRFPAAPDDAPRTALPRSPREGSTTRRERVPPLLTNERVMLTRDGEVFGDAPANWTLPFGRGLLDELLRFAEPNSVVEACPEAGCTSANTAAPAVSKSRGVAGASHVSTADQEFVAEWYHALASYLFATGMNGDATAHLVDAARVLPDDPRLLFDRGSHAETFGLAIYQAVQDTASAKPDTYIARIPGEEKTNGEAERLYRRALEVDPGYHEARVRLARLLQRRGQHDEAATHIQRVLEADPPAVVGFYALIVGGRVAAAGRRYDDALQRYRTAAQRYPGAQSALLGASHAALMLADVTRTLAPIEELGADASGADVDPWQDYQLGAGRDVNELMRHLWTRISK